jgi:pilus assembly protein Flp/PilA
LKRGQSGQGLIEYALILILVSVVAVILLLTLGKQVINVFSNVIYSLGT